MAAIENNPTTSRTNLAKF